MWIVKWIIWVVLVLFLIYFGAENSSQIVYIKFLKWRSPDLQLWLVMYLSFGAGILVWLFASIFQILKLKSEMRKINRENNDLKKELDELRNISIEEETSDISELEKNIM